MPRHATCSASYVIVRDTRLSRLAMAVRECNAPKQPMGVLILDMLLSEQNGLAVIRALRGVDQAVPIIAISGYGHTGPVDVLVTVTRQASGMYSQAGGTRPHVSSMQYASFSMTYSLSWRIW